MATAIPAALAGLLAQIRSAVDLTAVSVHDGKPEGDILPDWIAVGYNPTEGASAVDFAREWGGIGAQRVNEAFAIHCTLRCGGGDADDESELDYRTRAFDLLDLVIAAVAADYTLGASVREAAVLGTGALEVADTSKGAVAGLRFRVECEATINQS